MDARVPQLDFSLPDGGGLSARVFSRAYPGGLGVFDDNWLNVELRRRGGARPWTAPAFLRAGDFARFHRQLAALVGGAVDRAAFAPRDPWLWIAIEPVETGYQVGLAARDGHTDRALQVVLDFDSAAVAALERQVAAVADAFPVIR